MKILPIAMATLVLAAWDTPPAQTPAPWAKSASNATANATATASPKQTTVVRAAGGRSTASANQNGSAIATQGNGPSTVVQGAGNVWYPNAASAVAPPIMTYNPCAGESASGAVQAPVFGLSLGGNTMDRGCQIMNTRVPYASEWAAATLCRSSSDVRRAAMDIGHPCPQDRPAETTPVATPVSAPSQPVGYDGYCFTMSRAEKARHPECK